MKPIPDKAEVALEYPDKFYSGPSSDRRASMRISTKTELRSRCTAPAMRKRADPFTCISTMRCFADILRDLAKASSAKRPDDAHREALRDAAKALYLALKDRAAATGAGKKATDDAQMTPDEEVLLLHVLE